MFPITKGVHNVKLYHEKGPKTIIDLLEMQVKKHPNEIAYEFIYRSDIPSQFLSYQRLSSQARAIACELKSQGLNPGSRALLMYPPGLDLILAYFGCIYAGVIAVLIYPPTSKKVIQKLHYIIEDATPEVLLTTQETYQSIEPLLAALPEKKTCVFTDTINIVRNENWALPEVDENSLVFLQYTSGSTNQPKGVMVTHSNIIHNLGLIYEAYSLSEIEHIISWLPPYHDMGFIVGVHCPIFSGIPVHLMSHLTFLINPVLWLKTISKYQNVASGGPNFAFDYCVEKTKPEQKKELDFRSWKVAFNGAEPVRYATMERFCNEFADCGFQKSAIQPSYGMAEATLMVSTNKQFDKQPYLEVSSLALQKNEIKLDDHPENNIKLISAGVMFQNIKVVNPQTFESCADKVIGEIWISSDSVCAGYWNKPEASKDSFQCSIKGDANGLRYYRSGDLGFIYKNQLYIVGRLKDLIIIHGKNYYPQDIEAIVEASHPSIRRNCIIAFSIDEDDEEHLVIVCGTEAISDESIWKTMVDAICHAVSEEFELVIHTIAFVRAKSIPKTTSGKVQRQPCKLSLLQGTLETTYVWKAPRFSNDEDTVASLMESENNDDAISEWMLNWISRHTHQNKAEISLSHSLIEYGLDSLAIIQFVQDIGEHLGVTIDPVLVWDYPNPQHLAKYLQENHHNLPKISTITQEERQENRLSPGQQRLWFMHMLVPDAILFNIACAFKLQGSINTEKMQQACEEVVERHTVLRTAVTMFHERSSVIILSKLDKVFLVFDGSEASEEDIHQFLITETMKPYDLAKGNLIRIRLLKLNENEAILLIAAHHIIFDGWSASVLMRELLHYYEDKRQDIPALPIQYYDYANWQHQELERNELSSVMDYWQNYLKDAPTYLPLPLDNPRAQKEMAEIASLAWEFSETVSEKIDHYCQQEGITPFILFFTAYQLLLERYTHQKDMIIGVPISGRNIADVKNLVGFFVNTLPIRLTVEDRQTLHHLLQTNQKTMNACYRHQSIPLASLLNQLKIERDLAYEPLFQVMFVMQNIYPENIDGDKVSASLYWAESGQLPYDLTMEVAPKKELVEPNYKASIKYNCHLFKAETIQLMSEHYKVLINAIMEDASKQALKTPMLLPREQEELLQQWNVNPAPYPSGTLHTLFEQQAELTPNARAVKVDNETITYRELNEKANQLAHYLLQQTIPKDAVIAVSQTRCLDLIISFLGVLKAGAAYLYLDPDLPKARKEAILADSQAILQLSVLNWSEYKELPSNNPLRPIESHDLAYIIYTSGSTGLPKGVMIEHGSFCNQLNWYINTPIDVEHFIHLFSFSFDGGLVALWWPLVKGGTVIIPGNVVQNKQSINSFIKEEKITALHVTPSLLEGILAVSKPNDFKHLRDLVLAGEAFTPNLLQKIKQQMNLDSTRIWNLYGVSECAVVSTYYRVQGDEIGIIPIGKPTANTCLYVLDKHFNPTPVGVAGELYIGGPILARAYLNQAQLTAEKFVTSPFSAQQKLYKTGDWVSWNAEGNLQYIGRKDRQTKIRGHRVELSAIENLLMAQDSVKEALVIVRNDVPGQHTLAAYIVGDDNDLDALKTICNQNLPTYMVPNAWIFLDKMPVTVQGKVDVKNLPAPNLGSRRSNYVAPRDEKEKILVDIWSQVLHLSPDNISITDNFFEIGGDSILSIQFVFLCREKQWVISPSDLFVGKTIEKIAPLVQEKTTPIIAKQVVLKETVGLYQRANNWLARKIKRKLLERYNEDNGRIKLEGEHNIPSKGPLIIATNHLLWSHLIKIGPFLLDTLNLTQSKPYTLSARALKFLHPITALFVHPIYLKRSYHEHDSLALEKCIQYLKNGKTLLISPEGKKNQNQLIKAKTGIAFLASHAGATILPVALFKIKSEHRNWLGFRKGQMIVRIGNKIDGIYAQNDRIILNDLTAKVMHEIAQLLPEEMRGTYQEKN